ncbi:protein-arginine deiminase family protein [Botrimarina sp.]|uniref:protein-arginine deiminase family protein n=1 Tax=Botrimarina sp. TaxID=2795802 RepID=UPI0032EE1D92
MALRMLAVFLVACTAAADEAPLVVRSSLAPAETVFVREFPGRNERLVEQLRELCDAVGAELHVVPAGEPYAYNHVWLQDATEFLERSDGSGTVALAANRDRAIDAFAGDRLEGVPVLRVGEHRPDYARGEGGVSWIDWYGNLEASPPTDAWPHGRVLYGFDPASGAQLHPEVVDFLTEQGLQAPLRVDVGWLQIKHVDEMVSFLPAKGGGFYVAVPDPTAALDVLRGLAADGHGAAPLLGKYEAGATVAGVLADEPFVAENERLWAQRIEPAAKKLLSEIGVDADRLVRLPVLFHAGGAARTPNVVNALVLPGRDGAPGVVAMSDPDGPVVGGHDALRAEVVRRLEGVDAAVRFVDDRQYHKWSGNVHCATNAIRPLRP